MEEMVATLGGSELSAWEQKLRQEESSRRPPAAAYDPLRTVAAERSFVDEAVQLVRRGVRVVPVAEALPLVPLYARLGQEVPAHIRVAHEDMKYDFYLVQLTFNLIPEEDQVPDYAEFVVAMYDDLQGERKSRAINVFPQRIESTWLKAEGGVSVSLDASLKFEAGPVAVHGVEAQAKAGAGANVKVLAGPFKVEFSTTDLEVIGEGDREVTWIYRDRRALSGKNDFRSFLVLKIGRETTGVRLGCKMGVRTYRRSWETLWLREHLPILRAEKMLELEILRGEAARS